MQFTEESRHLRRRFMSAPKEQESFRLARALSWLALGMGISSAIAFAPVPEDQQNKESQAAELRRFLGHKDSVWSVALSADGRYALSGSYDQTVRLWEVASGKELKQFTGHTCAVLCVAFSSDSKFAVSATADGSMRLWDVPGGTQ